MDASLLLVVTAYVYVMVLVIAMSVFDIRPPRPIEMAWEYIKASVYAALRLSRMVK